MQIGVFDSGYGGLSVFREIARELSEYDFLYLGDHAHAPYGDRPREEIYQLTKHGCDRLFREGCVLVVLACNTASAVALRRLQQEWLPTAYPDRKILGVLVPLAEHIGSIARPGSVIGVLATEACVDSGAYVRELRKFIPASTPIVQQACPKLAPLIEQGEISGEKIENAVREYATPLKKVGVNLLILGCTHYLFIRDAIQREMGDHCFLPDPARAAADSLRGYLLRHPEVESRLSKGGTHFFLGENFAYENHPWITIKGKEKGAGTRGV